MGFQPATLPIQSLPIQSFFIRRTYSTLNTQHHKPLSACERSVSICRANGAICGSPSPRMASVSICAICGRNIRVPHGHSTSHIPHPTFHTFKRPLVHEVFAKVGSLLALDALLHLTWFGGVGNHADGVVVAHVFPQPVEQHHHLVFHA